MQRKQRYNLDVDDILNRDLYTPKNADATVQGVNESGTRQWNVPRGGTNNASFDDQKLILYDDAAKQLRSSSLSVADIEDIRSIAGSGFYTGALTQDVGTDVVTPLAATPTLLASYLLNRPTDGKWVWGRIVFTTRLASGNTLTQGVDDFKMLLADDLVPPAGWVFSYVGPFLPSDASDTYQVTWMGEGPIPVDRQLDSSLTFNIYANQAAGGGADVLAARAGYTIIYFRGVSAAEAPIIHGIPTFISPVGISVPLDAFGQFIITSYVPETASAVLLQTIFLVGGPNGGDVLNRVEVAKDLLSPFYIVGAAAASGTADGVGTCNQSIAPFASVGGVRSFYIRYAVGPPVSVNLIGYIS